MKILLADDEKTITLPLSDDLREQGHEVVVAHDGISALAALRDEHFDCLIADIRMPGLDGMELLKKSKTLHPDLPVILITGYASYESVVEAMRAGAYDYLRKPFRNEEVIFRLVKLEEGRRLKAECQRLKAELGERYRFHNLIGKSEAMQKVYSLIETVAGSDCTVLIEGESGTGKELVAHALHYNSPRREHPFVKFSCSGIPETLVEDELFGHEKGAFTDARTQKIGRFESAHRGSIFLDDIDDMSPRTQVKLLRVLQDMAFERIGGTKTVKVDVRVIAATKTDLRQAVSKNLFREDLFFRLNVVTIKLPPLRERITDIPLLCEHFIKLYSKGRQYEIPKKLMAELQAYNWPGNVRELEKAVERAIVLAGGENILRREHLLPYETRKEGELRNWEMKPLRDVVAQAEMEHIRNVLKSCQGNRTHAAEILGISRKCLWEKMKEYGID